MNTNHSSIAPTSASPATSESVGRQRRPGGRTARVQAAVFEATIDLLQKNGYEALSFATIARHAGVHEATLYRRWRTKEQLIVDAVSSQAAKDIPIPDTGTLRSDLIQLLQFLRAFLQSPVGQAIAQAAISTSHIPELSSYHKDIWRYRRTHLQIVCDRAITRGELSPQTDFQLLLETLIGIFYLRFFLTTEPVEDTLPERVVDLVLSGASIG